MEMETRVELASGSRRAWVERHTGVWKHSLTCSGAGLGHTFRMARGWDGGHTGALGVEQVLKSMWRGLWNGVGTDDSFGAPPPSGSEIDRKETMPAAGALPLPAAAPASEASAFLIATITDYEEATHPCRREINRRCPAPACPCPHKRPPLNVLIRDYEQATRVRSTASTLPMPAFASQHNPS